MNTSKFILSPISSKLVKFKIVKVSDAFDARDNRLWYSKHIGEVFEGVKVLVMHKFPAFLVEFDGRKLLVHEKDVEIIKNDVLDKKNGV